MALFRRLEGCIVLHWEWTRGFRVAHLPPVNLPLLTFNILSFSPFLPKPKSKQEGEELGRVQGLAGGRARWRGKPSFSSAHNEALSYPTGCITTCLT